MHSSFGNSLLQEAEQLITRQVISHARFSERPTQNDPGNATSISAQAQVADNRYCAESYYQGVRPAVLNEKLDRNTQDICYPAYVSHYSGITRTPLYAANHLTAQRVNGGCGIPRKDVFHPDPALSKEMRSELRDYVRSGYDKGHMIPNDDFGDMASQATSFSLANMAPQIHGNNAGVWLTLENGARNAALASGEVYVVSGPLFAGNKVKQLNGRVMVPTAFFKAVYNPKSQEAGVYITQQTDDQSFELISLQDLANSGGVDVFPDLSSSIKETASQVLKPDRRTHCKK